MQGKKIRQRLSRPFLLWTISLIVVGFFVFSSASLGILARSEAKFSAIAFKQLFFGLFIGSILCVYFTRIDYHIWKKYSFYLLLGSILLTLCVFLPYIGFEHGGAKRWIDLRIISFQPSEILKLTFIAYLSLWFSLPKAKPESIKYGLIPFVVLTGLVGFVLLIQPDTDTFALVFFASLAIYLVAGAKWKHILMLSLFGVALASILYFTRPYIAQRIDVLLHPQFVNTQTSGYQAKQAFIAIGSGGVSGRGFGQSIQKFHYLPEPIGDSIFAVAGEEFGFIGTSIIVLLFVLFALEGFKIALNSKDEFGKLFAVGIIVMIIAQTFINIGGMTGLLPLTGITLPFMSHGSTALIITLIEAGIVLNISRHRKVAVQ